MGYYLRVTFVQNVGDTPGTKLSIIFHVVLDTTG